MSTFNNSLFLLGDLPPAPPKKAPWSLKPVVFKKISTSRFSGADFLVFGPLVDCTGAVWHVAVTPLGDRKDKALPLTRGEPAEQRQEVLDFRNVARGWKEIRCASLISIINDHYNYCSWLFLFL